MEPQIFQVQVSLPGTKHTLTFSASKHIDCKACKTLHLKSGRLHSTDVIHCASSLPKANPLP